MVRGLRETWKLIGCDLSVGTVLVLYLLGRLKKIAKILGQIRPAFLNRRAAARYRALASIIPGRERFSWN